MIVAFDCALDSIESALAPGQFVIMSVAALLMDAALHGLWTFGSIAPQEITRHLQVAASSRVPR